MRDCTAAQTLTTSLQQQLAGEPKAGEHSLAECLVITIHTCLLVKGHAWTFKKPPMACEGV